MEINMVEGGLYLFILLKDPRSSVLLDSSQTSTVSDALNFWKKGEI